MADSRCGLLCNSCTYKEPCNCGGCIETNGHPFHGECPVAVCCQAKALEHCGLCADIPCKLLIEYSCDSEHGDTPHGARIEQYRMWAALDLFKGQKLSVGKCAELAGLTESAFIKFLGENNISIYGESADIISDYNNA